MTCHGWFWFQPDVGQDGFLTRIELRAFVSHVPWHLFVLVFVFHKSALIVTFANAAKVSCLSFLSPCIFAVLTHLYLWLYLHLYLYLTNWPKLRPSLVPKFSLTLYLRSSHTNLKSSHKSEPDGDITSWWLQSLSGLFCRIIHCCALEVPGKVRS